MKIKPDMTVQQLLFRFPNGFTLSNTYDIYDIVGEPAKNPGDLPMLIQKRGGYVTVAVPEIQDGDEFYLLPKPDN